MQDTAAPTRKMYLTFAGVYLAVTLVLAAVPMLFGFDLPSVTGIIAIMASAMAPGQIFVKATRRLMTSAEKAVFATFGTMIVIGISLVLFGMFMAIAGAGLSAADFEMAFGMPLAEMAAILAIGAVIGIALSWVAIYFGLGVTAKATLKALEKQDAR